MLFNKNAICLISLFLIGLLLSSCAQYTAVRIKKEPNLSFQGRSLHLIWKDRVKNDLYMTEAVMKDNNLIGKVHSYTAFKPYKKKEYLVSVYVDPSFAQPDSLPVVLSLPISKINKIEVYDYNLGLSILSTVFTGALMATAVVAVVGLIVLLTKESCPFIYVNNGETFDFTGEIYSGAIYPSLERDDYLPLPTLKPVNNQYQLKMANYVKEIQSTNLTELMVVDHPKATEVLVDKYGKYQTFGSLQKPLSALTENRNDILPLLATKDSLKYLGDSIAESGQSMDKVYLTFDRPKAADTAKLVIRAKNSYWLDYTLGQFFDLFGDKYQKWFAKQKKTPDASQRNWPLEQGIPLAVSILQNGEWKFVDYFNVIGPMAEKDIVMPIDISGLDSDKVQVKLESGFLFWELNYAGMDFSPQQKVYQQMVPLSQAIDHRGKDVTALLNRDDKKYFVMPEIGNQAAMEFTVPPLRADCERTVFLHSKGHYEVLRNPGGSPDISYLESFRTAGKFSQFSRDKYLEMKESLSR